MTELDNIILDILGKESPVVAGLPVRESLVGRMVGIENKENAFSFVKYLENPDIEVIDGPNASQGISSTASGCVSKPTPSINASVTSPSCPKIRKTETKEDLIKEQLRLKNEKLRLEIKLLRKQCTDLEIDLH